MIKMQWINENPGADRSKQGTWSSAEGRFLIAPIYRGTVNPDTYKIEDMLTAESRVFGTVRKCKQWALQRIARPRDSQY